MQAFVTGAAGFIASNLVDRLLGDGHTVVGFDNLSTGFDRFLEPARAAERFRFVQGDVLDTAALTAAARGADMVFHLAANADVRFGTEQPRRDLEQNTIATFNVLEAMRANGIRRIAFSSTGSVYGEAQVIPTPEDAPFPQQTSLYGASKLAGEGLIQAYCEGFGYQGYIFRFVSILGERYTHGHVFDFYRKLLATPGELAVLGNGKQRKSYLYIQDCIDAILLAVDRADDKVNIFNLGADEYCEVNDSIGWITGHLGLKPKLSYSGGDRGWIGDNPFIYLDCKKIRSLGWKPKLAIRDAVLRTVDWIAANRWVFEQRQMKLAVFGLWHLGSVTAACTAAAGIETVGIDLDAGRIARLSGGEPPLYEPGLAELVRAGLGNRTLIFTNDLASARDADIIWVCHDTPVDDDDRADVGLVRRETEMLFRHLKDGAVVLVSAQLPAGSVAALAARFADQAQGRTVSFACSPENLRLGRAIEVFRNPGRIVVGVSDGRARQMLEPLLGKFCETLIWMSVESAEMVKHALNAFLAVSVTFTNELAVVCERVGADASEVEQGLRSDPRVGRNAYVRAGPAFAGGTLARDVNFLRALARDHDLTLPVMDGVIASNRAHGEWAYRQLRRTLQPIHGRTVGVLGLAYKAGTSALRRSPSIELINALVRDGARVRAFDPHVSTLPDDLRQVTLCADARSAAQGADALVVANDCPEFRSLSPDDIVTAMAGRTVLDAGRILGSAFGADERLSLISVGRIS